MANNENLIPIPGRLHSVATEGHVAGANEIYDDTLAKDQATINSEVNTALGTGGTVDQRIAAALEDVAFIDDSSSSPAVVPSFDPESQTVHVTAQTLSEQQKAQVRDNIGLGDVDAKINQAVASEASQRATAVSGVQNSVNAEAARAQAAEDDRYTKSETYTKEEVHNLVTTPNQEYVSVIATDQTTSVTDVLPATGAADTTYRVGNWDGTQYNDSVFSEYAWDGSTYIKLSTKSQIEDVYDISANHADTKYADLAAALGTNGANVPVGVRKGGMSVKYVQSSDNKYVQYRLMADEWSTTESDWQGVDDVPTAGSDNLVKSGGVAEPINMMKDCAFSEVALSEISQSSSLWTYEPSKQCSKYGYTDGGDIYDSVQMLVRSNTDIWVKNYDGSNLTICVFPSGIIPNGTYDSSASRYRSEDSNLPTESNKAAITSGSMLVITYVKNSYFILGGQFGIKFVLKPDLVSESNLDNPLRNKINNNVSVSGQAGYAEILNIGNNSYTIKDKNLTDRVDSIELQLKNFVSDSYKLGDLKNLGYNYSTGTFNKPSTKHALYDRCIFIGKGTRFYFTNPDFVYNPNYYVVESDPKTVTRDYYDEISPANHIFEAKADYMFFVAERVDGSDIDVTDLTLEINICENNPLIYGAIYDGETDCSEAIQEAVNIGGTIYFKGSGIALIESSVTISKSNVHIVADPSFTFLLGDGVNAPMFQTIGATYKWDDNRAGQNPLSDISFEGGKYDFNASNQTEITGKSMHWQSGIMIVDVNNFRMENVYLTHSIHFAFLGAGLNNATFRDIVGNNYGGYSNDILHFNGHIYDLYIDNVFATANDDLVAINICGDYNTAEQQPWQVRRGDGKRICIKNIHSSSALRAIRLMSGENVGERLEDVVIDGVYGDYYWFGVVNIGCWRESSNFGDITIMNVNARTTDTSGDNRKSVIDINTGFGYDLEEHELFCNIKKLTLKNVCLNNTSSIKNHLLYMSNANNTIDSCVIDNVDVAIPDDADMSELSLIKVRGSATTAKFNFLSVSNVSMQSTENKYDYFLLAKVTRLAVSNCDIYATHKYKSDLVTYISESNVFYDGTLNS